MADREQAESCRRLWLAVLSVSVEDVLWAAVGNPARAAAYGRGAGFEWIGTAGFREVCLLAGVDPAWLARGLREAVSDPSTLRQVLARLDGRSTNRGRVENLRSGRRAA